MSALNLLEFTDLSPATLESMQELANRARDFLALPVLEDDFPDHFVRSEWRDSLLEKKGPQVAEYFRSNRLALKKVTPLVFQSGSLLGKLTKEAGPSARIVRAAVEEVLQPLLPTQNLAFTYMAMPDRDKVTLILDFSDRVRDYLTLVTKFREVPEQKAA